MFMIVALIYLISAGEPVGAPLRVTHREAFTSMDACSEYLKSDQFASEREALSARIKSRLASLPSGYEDVLPDIAITASCQTDTRV